MRFHDVLPELLGSKTKARIMQALLSSPTRQWTGRELARQAGVSPPQAQQALRNFEVYDLVFSRPIGKSRVWTLNSRHVFVLALQTLLAIRQDFQSVFLDSLRSKLKPEPFGKIREITLYGSVARGQDAHGSDIDVFVVVSDPAITEEVRQACLGVSVDLLDRFGKVVMPLVWSPRDFARKNPQLIRNIRNDGITFYGSAVHDANG